MLNTSIVLNKTSEIIAEYSNLTGCDKSAVSMADFIAARNQAIIEIQKGIAVSNVSSNAAKAPVKTTPAPKAVMEETTTFTPTVNEDEKEKVSNIEFSNDIIPIERPTINGTSKRSFLKGVKG